MDKFVMEKLAPKTWELSGDGWLVKKDVQGFEVYFHTEKLARILSEKNDGSEQYLPLLKQLIEEPFEKWVLFLKHKGTGKVEVVQVYIAAYHNEKPDKGYTLILKCDPMEGKWVASDFFKVTVEQANLFRAGRLIYGRPESIPK